MQRLTLNESDTGIGGIQSLICNLSPSAKVRQETMEGRNYTVVPMIILTEGVHQGSDGPLYYPKGELAKTPVVWNHKPVVVYHPTMNGQGISACDPAVINTRKVGIMMNTKFEKGRLKSEAWIEVDRANAVDPRIMEAVNSKRMMELSTGVFVDAEETPGTWNQEEYKGIARNFRPDHLALLPDKIGACSIQDGAGFLRNMAPEKKSQVLQIFEKVLRDAGLQDNELSFSNIREAIGTALRARFKAGDSISSMLFVEDVYSDFVVYSLGDTLYRLGYEATDTGVALSADQPEEVVRVVEYRTPAGAFVANEKTKEENTMNKQELVAAIVKNEGWAKTPQETLMGMTEAQVQLIHNGLFPPAPPEKKETPAITPVGNVQTPTTTPIPALVTPPAAPVTLNEYIAGAPKEIQQVLQNGLSIYEEEKNKLVEGLLQNKQCPFSKEDLSTRPLGELRGLSKLAGVAVKPVANYGGQAQVTENEEVEEALGAPTINFAKPEPVAAGK